VQWSVEDCNDLTRWAAKLTEVATVLRPRDDAHDPWPSQVLRHTAENAARREYYTQAAVAVGRQVHQLHA
jgi:hypothetical protein